MQGNSKHFFVFHRDNKELLCENFLGEIVRNSMFYYLLPVVTLTIEIFQNCK